MSKYLNKYKRIIKNNENRAQPNNDEYNQTDRANKSNYKSNKSPSKDTRNKDRKLKTS